MTQAKLSKRQREALGYFRAISRRGEQPTCESIGQCMGIEKVSAFEHLRRLAEKGYLVRHPNRGYTLVETDAMSAIKRYRAGLIDDPEEVINICESELMGAA